MGERPTSASLDLYNNLAAIYDNLYGAEQVEKYEKICRLVNVKKFRRLIDVGCGTGLLFQYLKTTSEDYLGIDVSRNMIDVARKRSYSTKPNFLVAVSPQLPLRNDISDCCVTISLLEQDRDLNCHIKEFERVTSPNGTIMMTSFEKNTKDQNQIEVQRIGKRECLHIIPKGVIELGNNGTIQRRDFKN